MEKQKPKYRKIPMGDIAESPQDGIYVTKADMQKCRLFFLAFMGITGLSLVLMRKK